MQIEMDPFLEEINPILDFESISFPTKFLLFAHILLICKKTHFGPSNEGMKQTTYISKKNKKKSKNPPQLKI